MRNVNMQSIRSVDRSIDVLQSFSIEEPTLTVEEISEKTNIPHSTVYRILYTLERRGYVRFSEKTSTYRLGVRLMEFSYHLSSVTDVTQEAEEYLIELHSKTNQTVLMALEDGDRIIYVYKKENYEGLKFSSVVGQRRPYLYGVLGPVLLAYLPDKRSEQIIRHSDVHNSSISISNIYERLKKIKKEGMYIESNETNLGVTGVGVPIFGANKQVVAAIGVIGPLFQMENQMESVKKLILETSTNISKKMGLR
ncbi:IclR family transcriptional regulator [Pseudalkalibacillus sp. A8]|uniref:IclR family transcriptional regulator n=1 Tax=Pseudalkalibacillus sp. A8 TaxID=3382641 RepID=UPI0038B46C78